MKTTISKFRTLMMLAAMTGFASGAWAQEAGEEPAPGDEVVEYDGGEATGEEVIFHTGVVEEEVADGGASGEEIIYMTAGSEEVVEGGEPIVDDGVVTGYTDSEGNVVYFRSDSVDSGEDVDMIPLMAQSGASGEFVTVSDTTAEQGGIDSGVNMGIDVVDSGQAAFAGPISVETTAAAASAGGSAGGTATRISGGHLSASSQQ